LAEQKKVFLSLLHKFRLVRFLRLAQLFSVFSPKKSGAAKAKLLK
jgi:hypothetical protein